MDEAGKVELSRARADAVKRHLVNHGIDETRVTTMGLGSRYAVGGRFEPATVASDRRVELWAFMK
jgi:outer membrane protein OmpA-like peptidoglycan-associated protein